MGFSISNTAGAVGRGVAAAGREVSAAAQAVQKKLEANIDAFEASPVGDHAAGRFTGGLLEGTAQMVTGLVNIAGGVLQLGSADTRRDVAKTVTNIAKNPGDAIETISDVVVSAWREDPAHFLGEAASLLVPGAIAKTAVAARATAVNRTAAASSLPQKAAIRAASAHTDDVAAPASTQLTSTTRPAPSAPPSRIEPVVEAPAAPVVSMRPPTEPGAATAREPGAVTAVGANAADRTLKTQPLKPAYVGEENGLWGAPVRYLSASEQQAYKVTVRDGKIYDAQGKLFDSTSKLPFARQGDHQAIFVLSDEGDLFATTQQMMGHFHHSTFVGGKPVAGAGEMRVKEGVLKHISPDESGHYKPGPELTRQVAEFLKKGGVAIDEVPMTARRVPGHTLSDALVAPVAA